MNHMNAKTVRQFLEAGLSAQTAVDKLTNRHRQSRVINPDNARRWALDYADHRYHKFDHVSERFLNAVEANAKSFIRDRIDRSPAKRKTLM
jgi:hypothetical protein